MLPRRSAVLRYLLVIVGIFVVAFFWLTNNDEPENPATTATPVDVELLSSVNESVLRQELDKLKLDYVGSEALMPAFNLQNVSLLDLRQLVAKMRQNRPKNPHPFKYVINPTAACNGDIFLLIYIHSAPNHFKQRMSIRETWGSVRNFDDIVIKVVFLCGIVPSDDGHAIQDALSLEADAYGDIIQEDFVDSYRNLTYKGIMGLKWVSTYCQHAQFLLKSDDDIFINIFSLVRHLRRIASEREKPISKLLLCLVWYHMKVMRDPHSKWYLSPTEFPDDYFPTYCSGSAFILTPDVAGAMFNASFRVPFFWVDDFYVTGLLAREVGVTHENFNSVYFLSPSNFLRKFTEPNISLTLVVGHVHKINYLKVVWNNVLAEHRRLKNAESIMTTLRSGS